MYSVSAKNIFVQVGGNTTDNATMVFQPAQISANLNDIVIFNCTSLPDTDLCSPIPLFFCSHRGQPHRHPIGVWQPMSTHPRHKHHHQRFQFGLPRHSERHCDNYPVRANHARPSKPNHLVLRLQHVWTRRSWGYQHR